MGIGTSTKQLPGTLGSGTFGALPDPVASLTKNAKPKVALGPTPPVPDELDAQLSKAAEQTGQLRLAKEKEEAFGQSELAKAESVGATQEAQQIRADPFRAEMQAAIKERRDETFVPSKENVSDIGGLFTLTNLLGFMLGGRSKGNAQQAMSAMNGMLEGHQKGREDLYKKEKDLYDVHMKALDKTIDSLAKEYQDAVNLYARDRAAGLAAARDTVAKHNANFIKDAQEKYGLAYAYDKIKDAVRVRNQAKEKEDKLKAQEDARQDKFDMARLVASLKQEAKQTGGSGLGVPDLKYSFQLGVPITAQTPYRGLDEKQKAATFQSELKKAETEFATDNANTQKARKTIDAMTEAEAINNKISTGKLSRFPGGESVQTMLDSDAARFDSIAKDQARNAYVKGEGALSDSERKMFEKSSISLANPAATNAQIIKVTKEVARRNIEHNDYLQRYFAANKTLFGAEENWTRYLQNNPLFAPGAKESNLEINPNQRSYQQYFQEELRRQYGGE